MDALLDRLLDVPYRDFGSTYSNVGANLKEFAIERFISVAAYRLFGIANTDIRFEPDNNSIIVGKGNEPISVDDGEDITRFSERYIYGEVNTYSLILDELKNIGDVFLANPMAIQKGFFDEQDNRNLMEILFVESYCKISNEDIVKFSEACPNVESYIYDLADYIISLGGEPDEKPDLTLFFFKSEPLGRVMSDQESELYKECKKAISVFADEFAGKVVDGVFYGCHAYGTYDTGYGDDEEPLILQTSTIAAIKVLTDTLK